MSAFTALSFLKDYGSDSSIHIGINTSTLFDIWTGNFIKNKEVDRLQKIDLKMT